ncbi:MAG TPA: efflux RND transporter periplasmic adaptor subunit [Polyangiaceae bacterium]|nr:efflux RND transporter periplasmic adaptor subunit [Polyangiaceae bacterium]
MTDSTGSAPPRGMKTGGNDRDTSERPASGPAPRATQPPTTMAPRRRRRWWVWGLAATSGLAVAVWAWPKGASSALAAEAPDVPRAEGKRVMFSDNYAKRIALETVSVGTHDVVPAVSVVGTVDFDPEYVARVGTRLRGVVRSVSKFEGARVKRGDVLASIDSPELGDAQASVASLRAEFNALARSRDREQALSARNLTTPREAEEATAQASRSQALLQAAEQRVSALAGRAASPKAQLGVHDVTSPLDGVVVERHVAKGQLVSSDHFAFLIANLDHLWVELSVFERHLPGIKVGDEVELRSNSSAHAEPVKGRVARVGAVLEAESRSAQVRVELKNEQRRFVPGQSVVAVIRATAAEADDVPTVPHSAVVFVDGVPTVFVADSPTSVLVTEVELGESNGQVLHVKRGLSADQRVVTRGATALRNELFR